MWSWWHLPSSYSGAGGRWPWPWCQYGPRSRWIWSRPINRGNSPLHSVSCPLGHGGRGTRNSEPIFMVWCCLDTMEPRLCVVVQTVDTNPFKSSNRCVQAGRGQAKIRSKTLLSGVLAVVFNRKKNCKKVRESCYAPLLLDTSSFWFMEESKNSKNTVTLKLPVLKTPVIVTQTPEEFKWTENYNLTGNSEARVSC